MMLLVVSYVLSSNLLFLSLLGNFGVIYEVIMQKFRASIEPFLDLKFCEYVEYLVHVFKLTRPTVNLKHPIAEFTTGTYTN